MRAGLPVHHVAVEGYGVRHGHLLGLHVRHRHCQVRGLVFLPSLDVGVVNLRYYKIFLIGVDDVNAGCGVLVSAYAQAAFFQCGDVGVSQSVLVIVAIQRRNVGEAVQGIPVGEQPSRGRLYSETGYVDAHFVTGLHACGQGRLVYKHRVVAAGHPANDFIALPNSSCGVAFLHSRWINLVLQHHRCECKACAFNDESVSLELRCHGFCYGYYGLVGQLYACERYRLGVNEYAPRLVVEHELR